MRTKTVGRPVRFTSAVIPVLAALVLLGGMVGPVRAQQPDEEARERALQEELREPRPIEAGSSVWIDEMTWMEVRDALEEGATTAIIPTGGIEQNGPYMVTGKHNFVLESSCPRIAKRLSNALCAPVVEFVPEGEIDPPSGHMRYPGTISLRQETFRALLRDIAGSLRAHGFTDVVFIGDSGGNQGGMEAVADELNRGWSDATAHYIPEYYNYSDVLAYMEDELGIVQPDDDGYHDNYYITAMAMVTDPAAVRYEQRSESGHATINGVSIVPKWESIGVGMKLHDFRADVVVRAIEESVAAAAADRR